MKCITCLEKFDKEQGTSIGLYYFICHECEKKADSTVKENAYITTSKAFRLLSGGGAYYSSRSEIVLYYAEYGDALFLALNHEVMHHVLHRLHGVVVSGRWDLVSGYGQYDG